MADDLILPETETDETSRSSAALRFIFRHDGRSGETPGRGGLADSVPIADVTCMAGCAHAVQAPGEAGSLFDDVKTAEAPDALAAFAGFRLTPPAGWRASRQRPARPKRKTLAGPPAIASSRPDDER